MRLAKKRGIKTISLTDHNSVKGVAEAVHEGKKIGVNVIPGVEIRTEQGEVLGYFIDVKNKELNRLLRKIQKRVTKKARINCGRLNKAGYPINYAELERKFPKARGNLNEFYPIYLLYTKGYGGRHKSSLKISKEIKSKIKSYKIEEISVLEAIKTIRRAGGVPVMAHPWIDDDVLKTKIQKLVKAGLAGLEINNGDRAPFRKFSIYKKIKRLAKKHHLVLTSGSDFHGEKLVKIMPGNHDLGKNNCDESVVLELLKRKVLTN